MKLYISSMQRLLLPISLLSLSIFSPPMKAQAETDMLDLLTQEPAPTEVPSTGSQPPPTLQDTPPSPEPVVPTVPPASQPAQPEPTSPAAPAPGPQEVSPGRATRSSASYLGIGGNIGIGDGDTEIGQGSFVLLSKVGLLPYLSVRPSIFFTDDITVLLPVTYDFRTGAGPTSEVGFRAAPFVGGGTAISTEEGTFDLLLTGGVDVPLTPRFTATGSINASVIEDPAVGILLGVGYNF